ncbi:MAG: signal recognition particle-docking protein FtsY [Alphaproteobacteria bacterium]|nr:signal recognition particle-docking protein FtsY [Alphaproteobacteria bacterium]
MGLWQKFKQGLQKTSDKLETVFRFTKLDDDALENLEEGLILSDMGAAVSADLVSKMARQKPQSVEEAKQILKTELDAIMSQADKKFEIDKTQKPFVILMVGVNGTGKTTTIGKLASQMKAQGLQVSMAAADTFRMAAVEQLQEWGKRVGCNVYFSKMGADPAGTAYDAYNHAIKNKDDVLFIDTAGRLQNKKELMAELQKIVRVIQKINPNAPHATLLTLDATVGQNAVSQVEAFGQITPLTGLIMSKLDGTAKGGILVALVSQFKLPIFYVGVGEKTDDLLTFDKSEYINSLLGIENV